MMDLRDHWAAEAGYSFGRNNVRVIELERPPVERVFQTDVHQFAVNGAYFFSPPDATLRPFATLGIGLSRFSPTDTGKANAARNFLDGPTRISSDTKLGLNFGGGFEGKVNQWFGVRLDFRDHITGIPRYGLPELPLNPGGVFYPVDGAVHDLEVAIGALFYFR